MMLNKTLANLHTLDNNIYRRKNSPTNTFLFIMNNSNTRKRCEICSKLTIQTPQRRSTVFIVNFEHISHRFSSVSTADLNQAKVC